MAATIEGVLKIPAPTTIPTVIAIAAKGDSISLWG
jgi:hypothetical protein